MPITIGSNINSLKAQRQLSNGTKELSKTFERLSSGLRINKSSDDAAGLAISESLKSDKRVLNQGVRNFNDGISLLNIADGAIENLSNIVTRLKELAEQSANGTYSLSQRKALDKEAQALSKEYTRIVQSTKFNGKNLLDGTLGDGLRLQGGYGVTGGIFSGIGGAIGDGTFTLSSTFSGSGPTTSEVHAADFNGDGNADIAFVDTNVNSVNVKLGNGNGTFQTTVTYQTAALAANISLAIGDFNGDGKLDLIDSEYNQSTLKIFTGKGDGTFNSGTSVASLKTRNITAGDFNNDGNLDLLSADTFDLKVSILLGNGNGTFQSRKSYSVSDTQAVQAADFNNDGFLDIVTSDTGNAKVNVLLNDGRGNFSASVSYAANGAPHSL